MILKITSIRQETKDTFSIIFEKTKGLNFYPGQYLDIELPIVIPAKAGIQKDSRILSISSSPSENMIMLTYKLGITPYKKKLETLRPEDSVTSSHPAGTVVIDPSSPIIMIAGGIGIAPYRSMIKWAVDRRLKIPITLIYSNSDEDIIFKKELDKWQKQLSNLQIHYIITSQDGRLDKDKISNFKFQISNSIFYLAGPPSLVDDFEEILLKLGVENFNIRADRFDGY